MLSQMLKGMSEGRPPAASRAGVQMGDPEALPRDMGEIQRSALDKLMLQEQERAARTRVNPISGGFEETLLAPLPAEPRGGSQHPQTVHKGFASLIEAVMGSKRGVGPFQRPY